MAYVSVPAFGGLLDSIKSGLSQVIPSHTIVGKALRGDTAGATADAAKYGAKAAAKATMPKAQSVQVAYPDGTEPGLFSPGGFVDRNQTYLLLGAAGLAAFLFLGRRGGRR